MFEYHLCADNSCCLQMAIRPSRQPVCFQSKKPIDGSYMVTPDGPVLAAFYKQYAESHPPA